MALATVSWASSGAKRSASGTLRWSEEQPGCTFAQGEDGKYRYGLWTDDFGIVMAVDAQEIEKARRRMETLFAVMVTVRYRGGGAMELGSDEATLEFVKHYRTRQVSLAPERLEETLQKDVDALAQDIGKAISKHPEQQAQKEAELREQQEGAAEMKEFLRRQALQPEAGGWLFFKAQGRWLGDWKKQEEFVLRIPVANRVAEFPFALPPSAEDFVLRTRPQN